VAVEAEAAERSKVPPADDRWHAVARAWYESLSRSGQRVYYEASDWATAYLLAESMSRDLKPQVVGITEEGEPVRAVIPLKGASLAAYLKGFTTLLVTEGDRRRARVELERADDDEAPAEDDPEVASLDEYRSRLSG
jgi:antitoxin (DNA-binding transcriptional repressor) of toxin-antitoxin stability system